MAVGIARNGLSFFKFRIPFKLLFIGGILSLHWLLFFGAIQVSSASITLACLGTGTFFTALLEPIFTAAPKSYRVKLLISGIVLLGLGLIYQAEAAFGFGILLALVSAFLSSLYSVLNKKYIVGIDTIYVNFMELTGSFIFLSACVPFLFWFREPIELIPQQADWPLLIALAWGCTFLAYVLSINALRHVSAFTYTLAINLEPVYGILMAWWLLGEDSVVHLSFILGTAIILSSVILYPWLSSKVTS